MHAKKQADSCGSNIRWARRSDRAAGRPTDVLDLLAMIRLTAALVLSFVGITGPAFAEKMSKEQQKALQSKLTAVFNSRGPQLDRCTERYLEEFPEAKGKVDVTMKVLIDGKVSKATVTTRLSGARNLRPCIERVVKTYVFGPTKTETLDLTIAVPVAPGVKFRLYGPGEKPERSAATPPQEGYIRFQGRSWTPAWNSNTK